MARKKKIIIGIHGLANKPEKSVLARWWRESLVEGLDNVGMKKPDPPFEMIHWADLLYKNPVHRDELFNFDALYNREPYVPAAPGTLVDYKDSWTDAVRSSLLDVGGGLLDKARAKFDSDTLGKWLLGKAMKDLAFYYDPERRIGDRSKKPRLAREVLKDELKSAVRKHKGKSIMIIAHSMGTIISYDVLRDLGRSKKAADTGLEIARFVTIGSPLGLPYVKGKIDAERDYDKKNRVRTPTVVAGRWVNFADPKDPVALDLRLRDDYLENKREVRVEDDLVKNDYHTVEDGEVCYNHHKSYGYLRTPELSRLVRDFLEG
ncbi:MAG: alpha/beta hydrolase [Acidobacteria bacterium]|nr:MAG: alpha/beta hydrolase [Acidobacteriota bacterium]